MPEIEQGQAEIIMNWLKRLEERLQILEGHQFPTDKETPKRETPRRKANTTLQPE